MKNGSVRSKRAVIHHQEALDVGQSQLDALLNFGATDQDSQFTSVPWIGTSATGDLTASPAFSSIMDIYGDAQSFEPRKGELVLYYENCHPPLGLDPSTQQFLMYSSTSPPVGERPPWRAGIVAQIPATRSTLDDLIPSRQVNREVENPDLFVIELYDDLASLNGSMPLQSLHVALDHIRPFVMLHELLAGQYQHSWHRSIKNAMNALNSICVVEPRSIKARPPMVQVSCNGAWIGAELILIKDVVRLAPRSGQHSIDSVMHVQDIRLEFDKSIRDCVANAHLIGTIYSLTKGQSTRTTSLSAAELAELPRSMHGYAWYPREDTRGRPLFKAALSTIVGRCFAKQAMVSMIAMEDLDSGISLSRCRSWSMAHDPERLNVKGGWRLTNDRSEALRLEMLGGMAIGRGRQREKLRTLLHDNGSNDWQNPIDHTDPRRRPLSNGAGPSLTLDQDKQSADNQVEDDQMRISIISDQDSSSDDGTVSAFVQEAINDGIMLPPFEGELESQSESEDDDSENEMDKHGTEQLGTESDGSRASKRPRLQQGWALFQFGS